jgi:hypothetical protein
LGHLFDLAPWAAAASSRLRGASAAFAFQEISRMASLRSVFGQIGPRLVQGRTPYVLTALLVAGALCVDSPLTRPQQADGCRGFGQARQPGGIMIDTSGAVKRLEVDALNQVGRERAAALAQAPSDLNQPNALRKISLRKLEEALAVHVRDDSEIPEEIKLLAGLQKIQYVFVYPEEHDIVLAGFGEGWKVDARGNIVGKTTGKPVLTIDDLLVALRHAEQSANGGISCSIDPTPEGLERLRRHVSTLQTIGDPQATGRGIEQALGPQVITVGGVPATTHFAHVLVAADYRMKRIGMNFDPSPVPGLSSYIQLLGGGGRGMQAIAPRWWLVPSYQPIAKDPAGLAFELRGSSVKCLTEDTIFAAGGAQRAGQSSPAAQRWADMMTTKYEALAQKEPIFAELQNMMDLAVVGALIVKENLAAKAGFSMPLLLNSKDLPNDQLNKVEKTDSIVSMTQKGSNWVISASGGVQIDAWGFASKQETDAKIDAVRTKAVASAARWWWD